MLDVFLKNVDFLDFARSRLRLERVAGDRTRFFADELHAVVLFRVVAGRDHDAAVEFEMSRRKVDHFRAALADIHDIAAGFREAANECIADGRTGQADVVADSDFLRVKQARENAADAVSEVFVDVFRIDAADIISTESLVAQFHLQHSILYS